MASKTGKLTKRRSTPVGGNKPRQGQKGRVVTSTRSPGRFGQEELFIVVALAVATLAVYGQVVGHQFIGLDDDVYVRDNPMVMGGLTLKGIIWAFTTFYDSNWHPLTWLSHMVDVQMFGLNAGGHLLINTLIHLSNTFLLFLFLKRVTGARWESAIVAALFALHPLHVESVAWAVERKDTLSTLFGLLCLLAYARYAERSTPGRYALVFLWLGLGLMAKPMLVTWPFVLLLLDYWPLRRIDWRPDDGIKRFTKAWLPLIREKLPLFCLVAVSMVVTYLAQSHQEAAGRVFDAPLALRFPNALVSFVKYVILTFWPRGLAVYYPLSRSGLPFWQPALAVFVLAVVTAVALREASKRPWLIVGWLWFVGTLIPVLGLMQVGIGEAMADRYHYVPSIGLFVALVFGFADLANGWRIGRVATTMVPAVILLLLAYLTAVQASRWRDTETLFEHTLSVTSDNVVIEYNLGRFLGQQRKYDQAIPHFAEALRIKPDFFDALVNAGLFFLKQGKTDEAISYYHRALDVKPDSANAHMQLALALVQQERKDDAVEEFHKAVDLAPNDPDIRTNLGLTLARQGKLSEASAQLNEALRINPASAEAHNNLGLVFLMAGQPEKSLPHFTEALSLKPNFTVARDNVARAQKQIELRKK